MTLIYKQGTLPKTPHTEFYAVPGVLALEEIHGCYGFSGPWSRKMHVRCYPTEISKEPTLASFSFAPEVLEQEALQPYLIHTINIPYEADALRARRCLVAGPKTRLSVIKTQKGFGHHEFFRNAENHEIFFVQDGSGTLHSEFGSLPLRKHVYVIVPKGTTYRIELSSPNTWLLLIESQYPIEWPGHYMNSAGQAHLTSPVVETEIETPVLPAALDQTGEFQLFIQQPGGRVTNCTLGHHPFDVCGWEGSLYPFLFDIANHHGIAREIHTAPPAHQTFQSGKVPDHGFSLCSFVPQMEGWHPKDVGTPYAHLNVDSDELMFFCNTSYGAREGVIKDGSLTFHPGGVPHSPHGNAAQKSLSGRGKMMQRLAVMLDTYFESLRITSIGKKYSDPGYNLSWYKARNSGASAVTGA